MAPQGINISYNQSGDITFTVTWHPSSINDALSAVNSFLASLEGEQKKEVKQPKPAAHKPKKTAPANNKRGRHLWTDDEKREAMRMYAAGEDLDIIVKKFNSTPGSVEKIMQKNGIKRPWSTKGNPSKIEPAAPTDEEEPV